MKETNSFTTSNETTMITMTVMHDNQDLNQDCEHVVDIHNHHQKFTIKDKTEVQRVVDSSAHMLCPDCFTTTIVEDYE